MRPAADFSGGFRFESGDYAKGYIFDAGADGKAKWEDKEIRLEGAVANTAATFLVVLTATFTWF